MVIFETENLKIRWLIMNDILAFHKMQSNPLVMQYATGIVKSLAEHTVELQGLIAKYEVANNDFWIYAVERKVDKQFVGTCALIKDGENDEIGYRFLQEYWGKGYGAETCKGLVTYCKKNGFKKLIAYVVDKNIASINIVKRLNFTPIRKQIAEDLQLEETVYQLNLC